MTGYRVGKVLYSREVIEARAAELGTEISRDFADKETVMIGILNGCVMWMSQLMKSVTCDLSIDFMTLSSYGSSTESSGVVKINKELVCNIEDKYVIIVEDIVDTGTTLAYLADYLREKKPADIKICTLLDKPSGRQVAIDADYVGFKAPDAFVVGYGLDFDERYRNLPYIAILEECGI